MGRQSESEILRTSTSSIKDTRMKKLRSAALLLLILALASCAKAPYRMAITDWSGNHRPYFIENEALNLHVWWDSFRDTGKAIDCSISNAFSADILWRGTLIIPESKPGQLLANVTWTPPFPQMGLKLSQGSYLAVCNFDNEAKATVPITVVSVPQTK